MPSQEQIGGDTKVLGQCARMVDRQLAFAAQNHPANVR
jgi:hypothetical protein